MTKKTWTSKPPRYQDADADQPPSYNPPPYTPEERTPLLSSAGSSYASPSTAGSSYASSSYADSIYTPSSTHASDTLSSAGSLPSNFPKKNRTLRRAFRELRRDYLLVTYHRALDALDTRKWRPPRFHWPGTASSRSRSEDGGVEERQVRRGRVLCVKGERKRRRRRIILCCNLLLWVLIALGIATFVKSMWWGNRRGVLVPGRRETVRVGIVGAGPAGVSAAHTLSTSFKSKDINLKIVIFEQKETIGGRMVFNPSPHMKELGRILHAEDVASGQIGGNTIKRRAKESGIDFGKPMREGQAREVGFFDGRELVAKLTRPLSEMSWGTWLGLLWKYKFSFLNAKELPKGTMKTFDKLLKSRETFESVSAMAESVGVEGAMGLGAVARLSLNGIGGSYVHEVLYPQLLRQTGQDATELSDLAISMALEREDQSSSAVAGSFEDAMEKFVRRSKAEVRLGTKVTGLRRELVDGGKEAWILELQRPKHEKTYETFDHVILAGPSSLLPNNYDHHHEDEVYYRSLFVTTLLSTKELNKEYFGGSDDMPAQILPIKSDNLPAELEGIHEISYVGDVFGPDLAAESVKKLYRILSDRSLSKEKILAFGEGAVLESWEERIANAYPLMYPRSGRFGDFKVQEGLWHTGVVEAIGSSVDLSWVAGENVGRLVAWDMEKKRS